MCCLTAGQSTPFFQALEKFSAIFPKLGNYDTAPFERGAGLMYHSHPMRHARFIYSTLLSALVFSGPAAADDLDAALEAQKKKSQRRIYSEQVQFAPLDLTVPQEKSAEELALDKKLREMDEQADAAGRAPNLMHTVPAAPVLTARPAQTENWLTPAMLDEAATVELPTEEESWLTAEANRQKARKEQEMLLLEKNKAEQLSREKAQQQQQSILPELDRLKAYQQPLQAGIPSDGISPLPQTPAYSLPGSSIRPAQPEVSGKPSRFPAASPAFSPLAGNSPALNPDPLQQRTYNSPFKLSSGLSSEPQEPAVLSPLQMIRKSSPINRADPFADDYMPQFKNSIWE